MGDTNSLRDDEQSSTLKICRQMTLDDITRHLLTQAKRSTSLATNADGETFRRCAYRGDGSTKCAVGALIPDEQYNPRMEGQTADASAVSVILRGHDLDVGIARTCQVIHDSSDVRSWAALLRRVYLRYELELKVLDDLEPAFMKKVGVCHGRVEREGSDLESPSH